MLALTSRGWFRSDHVPNVAGFRRGFVLLPEEAHGGLGASPKSTLLAYRGGAVCQIALHGCGMKRGCFNQYHWKMCAGGVARQCVDGPGAILFVGGAFVSLRGVRDGGAVPPGRVLGDSADQWSLGRVCRVCRRGVDHAAFFIACREAVESALSVSARTRSARRTPLRSYYMPEGLKRLIFVQVQEQAAEAPRGTRISSGRCGRGGGRRGRSGGSGGRRDKSRRTRRRRRRSEF